MSCENNVKIFESAFELAQDNGVPEEVITKFIEEVLFPIAR